MKKILLIIDSLSIGGAERAVVNLANGFLDENYSVDIISIDNNIKTTPPKDAKLHILDFKNVRFKYFIYARKLDALIKKLERDNTQSFDLILVNLQKASRLMKDTQRNNVYHIIRNTVSKSNIQDRNGLKLFFKKRKIYQLYNNKNLIVLSTGIKDDLLNVVNVKPKSIQVINNSIDIDFIEEQSTLSIKEDIQNICNDYIIHVGRFSDAKRHDILLKAFAQTKLDAKLVLLGDGDNRKKIVELIKDLKIEDKVIVLGFQSNPYGYIKNARLLVLSSDFEGMPNVLIESLALKTPVISTNCPSGPSEILTNGLEKYLVEPKDIEGLACLIATVYQTPYVVSQKAVDRFRLKNIINQYSKLIN